MKRALFTVLVAATSLTAATVGLTIGGNGAAAEPSYNPAPANKFHAPLSSMGLLAVTHRLGQLQQAARGGRAGSETAGRNAAAAPATPRLPSVSPGPNVIRFVTDTSYMPQQETSVAVDPAHPSRLLGGVNDIRGLTCPLFPASDCPSGFTNSLSGFTTSSNGGSSVLGSDDLPGVTVGGTFLWSWGDPGVAATTGGRFYYSSLAIDPNSNANGVELAISNGSLWSSPASCVTSQSTPDSNPCWDATFVSGNTDPSADTFEDKPMLAVDLSSSSYRGDAYVAWDHGNPDGTGSGYLARCTPTLSCTLVAGSKKPVSGSDPFPAFTTPVVGSDGTVYVTWCNYGTVTALTPITCKFRSSRPGGTHFGAARTITTIGGSGGLMGYATEQFRIANVPVLAVDDSGGAHDGNLYWVIDACHAGNYYGVASPDLPGDCGSSEVLLSRSTDGGTTWSAAAPVPGSGTTHVTVQPWVTVDQGNGTVHVDYYTSQFDAYNHRLDVEDARSANGGSTWTLSRLTTVSIEPDADPNYYFDLAPFGGAFVAPQFGDYMQSTALNGTLYALFSATYKAEVGTPQTDPWLYASP